MKGNILNIKLLSIAPHFQVFIKDQTIPLLPFLEELNVLIPLPYFSRMITKIPLIERNFRFLKKANESVQIRSNEYAVIRAPFFTLPIETIRKRNSFLAAKSGIAKLLKINPSFNLIHSHFIHPLYLMGSLMLMKNQIRGPNLVEWEMHGKK